METYTKTFSSEGFTSSSSYFHMRTDKQFNTSTSATVPLHGSYHATGQLVGNRNPFWRASITNGVSATTPLTATRYRSHFKRFHALSWWKNRKSFDSWENEGKDEANGIFPYPFPFSTSSPSASDINDISNRCIRLFRDRYNELIGGFLAGQDIGEWRETIHSFQRPAASIRDFVYEYLHSVKKLRSRYSNARKLLKAVSDTYLEFTFGWKPLALDVLEASKILMTQNQFVEERIKAKASKRYSGDISEAAYPGFGGYHNLFIPYQRYGYYKRKIVGGVRLEPISTPPILDRFGLSLPDFVPTVWELLPYSFVVDYFLNIGDIIDAYAHPLSSLSWSSNSVMTRNVTQFSDVILREVGGFGSHIGKVDITNESTWGGSAVFTVDRWVRSELSSSDFVPVIQLRLPDISSKPWRNLAALLGGRIKS